MFDYHCCRAEKCEGYGEELHCCSDIVVVWFDGAPVVADCFKGLESREIKWRWWHR